MSAMSAMPTPRYLVEVALMTKDVLADVMGVDCGHPHVACLLNFAKRWLAKPGCCGPSPAAPPTGPSV